MTRLRQGRRSRLAIASFVALVLGTLASPRGVLADSAAAGEATSATTATATSTASAPSTEASTAATAPTTTTSAPASTPAKRRGWGQRSESGEVHGQLQTRYRARRGPYAGEEIDLYQYLDLRVGNETDKVSGTLYLRANTELDKQRGPGDVLRNVDDTFDDPAARLYYGYVDVRDVGQLDRVRAGRQYIQELPGIWFDGVRVDLTSNESTNYTVYGGRPTHLFEDGSGGDSVVGLAAEHTFTEKLKMRFDLARVRDRIKPFGSVLPSAPLFRQESDLLTQLMAYYSANDHLDLDARATRIDDKFRTLRVAGNFRYPGEKLYVSVYAERQPNAFLNQGTEFSPYFDVLGSASPYTEFGTRATKSFKDVEVTLGASNRGVLDGEGVRAFEQDFSRYFGNLFFPALFGHPKTTLSLDYDRYLGDASDFGSLGGELGYQAGKLLRFSAGSSYALYDFDPLTGLLRDHVREHYLAVDLKLESGWRLRSRLVYEPYQDGSEFRTFELSARYSF